MALLPKERYDCGWFPHKGGVHFWRFVLQTVWSRVMLLKRVCLIAGCVRLAEEPALEGCLNWSCLITKDQLHDFLTSFALGCQRYLVSPRLWHHLPGSQGRQRVGVVLRRELSSERQTFRLWNLLFCHTPGCRWRGRDARVSSTGDSDRGWIWRKGNGVIVNCSVEWGLREDKKVVVSFSV